MFTHCTGLCLQSYIKVYYTKMAGKKGQDFMNVLKNCGLDFATLTLRVLK